MDNYRWNALGPSAAVGSGASTSADADAGGATGSDGFIGDGNINSVNALGDADSHRRRSQIQEEMLFPPW